MMRQASPPDTGERAIDTLLIELLSCHTFLPQPLRRHLGAACPSIAEAADLLTTTSQSGQLLSLAGGGTQGLLRLLLLAFAMLHRGVAPGDVDAGSSGRQAPAAEWTPADVDGIDALLSIIAACLTAAHNSLRDTISSDSGVGGDAATAAAHRAVVLIAEQQPCHALMGVLRPRDLDGIEAPAATASMSLLAAVKLLQLTSISPPLAAVLLPDLCITQFVGHVCDGITTALEVPSVAATDTGSLRVLMGAFAQTALTDPGAESDLAQQLLNTPAAGVLVLVALKVWSRSPLPELANYLHMAVHVTRWWLVSQKQQHMAAGLASTGASTGTGVVHAPGWAHHLQLTAEHVRDVVHATTQHIKVVELAVEALPLMWERLPASQRSRALMPIAVFGRRVLDATLWHLDTAAASLTAVAGSLGAPGALSCCPGGDGGSGSGGDHGGGDGGARGSGGSANMLTRIGRRLGGMSARITSSSEAAAMASLREALAAPGQDSLSLASRLLRLLCDCLVPRSGGLNETGPAWERIKPRALMVHRGKLCCSLEALLRASGGSPPRQVADLVHPTSVLTIASAALLCGDPQAPTVEEDTLSTVATMRKLLHYLLRSAPPLLDRGSAPPGVPAVVRPADRGEDALRAGACALSVLVDAATGVLNSVLQGGPLMTLRRKCSPGALNKTLSVLVQILPLAVRTHITAQRTSGGSSTWQQQGRRLLAVITVANGQGLGWFTALAGGPRLLQVMLVAAGAVGDWAEAEGGGGLGDSHAHGLEVGALCVAALLAAGDDNTWLADSRRLNLAGQASDWLGVKVVEDDSQQERPGSGLFCRDVLMAQRLRTSLSAYAVALLEALSPGRDAVSLARALVRSAAHKSYVPQVSIEKTTLTLHSYVLHEAVRRQQKQQQEGAAQQPGGSQPLFLVGCWHLRCTNLDGDSEAALKTFTCGGCMLARYCSKACQRSAWRGGHRAACNVRQRSHPATRPRAARCGQLRPRGQASMAVVTAEPACSTSMPGSPDSAAEVTASTAAAGPADTAAARAAATAAERKALLVAAVQVAKDQAAEAAAAAATAAAAQASAAAAATQAAAAAAEAAAAATTAAAASAAASVAAGVAAAQSAAAICRLDELRAQLASTD